MKAGDKVKYIGRSEPSLHLWNGDTGVVLKAHGTGTIKVRLVIPKGRDLPNPFGGTFRRAVDGSLDIELDKRYFEPCF